LDQARQARKGQPLSVMMADIVGKYSKTKSLISDLPIQIKESVQRLELYACAQVLVGALKSITAYGNITLFRSIFPWMFSRTAFLSVTVILTFSMINFGNGYTLYMAGQKLHELRKVIEQLNTYESKLKQAEMSYNNNN
jgi:hypothetical protein